MALLAAAASAAAPTCNSLGGGNGVQGGNSWVTVYGTNLTGGSPSLSPGTGLTISSVSSTSTTVNFKVALAANAPIGNNGVTITTSGGSCTQGAQFYVGAALNPTPTLSSVSPSTGKAGTSVPVTISGSGFVGYTVNLSSGITYTGLSGDSTSATLTLIIAAGASAGPYTITFSNNGGTSNGVTFTVTPAITPNTRRVILVN